MKMIKRTLTMLLVLTMLLGTFVMGVGAEGAYSTQPTTATFNLKLFGVISENNIILIHEENPTIVPNQKLSAYVDQAINYNQINSAGYSLIDRGTMKTDSGATPAWDSIPAANDQVDIYLTIVPKEFNISYTDGTNTVTVEKAASYGGSYVLADFGEPLVAPEGKVFAGWRFADNRFNNVFQPGAAPGTYGLTEDVTFAAVWDDAPAASDPSNDVTSPAGKKIFGAVVVDCENIYHAPKSYDYSIPADFDYTTGATSVVVYLSAEEVAAYVAAYDRETCHKHTYSPNRAGYAFVLNWNAEKNDWDVTPANIIPVCEYDYCSGYWHKHTVTYNDGVRNATVFSDITYTVKHGAKTPVPATPVRAGYKFTGWTPAVSSYTSKCVTYYATWVEAKGPSLTKEHVAYLKGYGKGLVKPEGEITRAEAITMLYRLMDKATVKEYYTTYNAFSDVAKDAWYNDAVSTLANAGVLRYQTGKLNPNEAITRAEFFYMLAKFSNVDYTGKCTFVDVPSTYWAYKELTLAQYLGWIKGYGGGILYPDDTITRAEVAASLNRVLGRTTCKVKDTKNFIDNPVNAWYYDDIVEASIGH